MRKLNYRTKMKVGIKLFFKMSFPTVKFKKIRRNFKTVRRQVRKCLLDQQILDSDSSHETTTKTRMNRSCKSYEKKVLKNNDALQFWLYPQQAAEKKLFLTSICIDSKPWG